LTVGDVTQAWKDWWRDHKGERITVAPYESVSDPYLRCLARKVDWGFEQAILAIGDIGGEEAKSVLEKFPNSSNWGIPTIPGNLSEALAKLGDNQKWKNILEEWQHGSDFTDAVQKLQYIGGRESVGLFIDRFDQLSGRAESSAKEREQCVKGLIERQKLGPGKKTDKYIQDSFCQQNYENEMRSVQLQRVELLGALGHMVLDPPLDADAPPTPENIQKWKDWWLENKDSAEFVSTPVRRDE
jgi:hypothetical protein